MSGVLVGRIGPLDGLDSAHKLDFQDPCANPSGKRLFSCLIFWLSIPWRKNGLFPEEAQVSNFAGILWESADPSPPGPNPLHLLPPDLLSSSSSSFKFPILNLFFLMKIYFFSITYDAQGTFNTNGSVKVVFDLF